MGVRKGQRTARITNSMNALCGESESREDIAAAQDEVSSVVVLDYVSISLSIPLYLKSSYPRLFEGRGISQFRKHAVNSRARATSCCEGYPRDFRLRLRFGGWGVGLRCL